jgi:hypothetical protein
VENLSTCFNGAAIGWNLVFHVYKFSIDIIITQSYTALQGTLMYPKIANPTLR